MENRPFVSDAAFSATGSRHDGILSPRVSQSTTAPKFASAGFCPVCGDQMVFRVVEGEISRVCGVHGAMRCYLDHDPYGEEPIGEVKE